MSASARPSVCDRLCTCGLVRGLGMQVNMFSWVVPVPVASRQLVFWAELLLGCLPLFVGGHMMQWLTEQAISVLGGALASARMFVASLAHVDCSSISRQLVF